MSLVNLSHVCSHLQNASKARLGTTSIPYTKLHATLSQELLKAGFISRVSLGGSLEPARTAASGIEEGGTGGASSSPSPLEEGGEDLLSKESIVTQQNRSTRRLWLGLKYWNNRPVITKMRMISKPTRRIWAGASELAALSRGDKAGYVDGMRQVGEAIFVSTDRGIMELRECVERKLGGQLLCRVW